MEQQEPESKLDVFEITAEPIIVEASEDTPEAQAAQIAAQRRAQTENVDHNTANKEEEEPPEELEEWKCQDSGLASPIACGDEEPPVDIGLIIDIGTVIVRETGLDQEIMKLLGIGGDEEEGDSEITCTQTIDEALTRTTSCSNGESRTEQCLNSIDPVTGLTTLACSEIIQRDN